MLHPAGAHVGSSHTGLAQCCQLMALPVSGLCTALKQQRMRQQGSSSGCCGRHINSANSPPVTAAAQEAESQMLNSSSDCCCRKVTDSLASISNLAASCSSVNSIVAAGVQHEVTAGAASTAAAAAALPQTLGCCCSHAGSPKSGIGQQQWACGAAAHRLQAMQGTTSSTAATQRDYRRTAAYCTASIMPAEVRHPAWQIHICTESVRQILYSMRYTMERLMM